MDGSFSLDSALERLLDRCPKLRSFPKFDWLSKKGDKVTEDEVVQALVEVFVNPSYTIPLTGCFRPIAEEVVVKTVELLRLVPNLGTNTDKRGGSFGEDRDLSEVYSVIEFYNRAGRGLDLHEHACLAFCRALDLAPFLLGSVESYFKFAPPPFERILKRPKTSDLSFEVGTGVLYAVRISYRLLLTEYNKFSEVWDLACFLELVSHYANLDLRCSTPDIVEVITDIRWCGLQIVLLILKLSDKAISNLGIGDEDAFSCLLRWKEFCRDVSLEDAGLYVDLFNGEESESQNESIDYHQRSCLQPSSLNTMPIPSSQCYGIQPQIKRQRNERSAANPLPNDISGANPFVLTSAVKKSYEMMLLAVSQRWPVLLYGPTGSGKSALISKLSQDSGNHVLSIHMDDQIDGRTLIGSYVCTEKPGEFRWQQGSLTQAVSMGYWVVFEDIDKAPSDVHSILSPLLDGARSFATGHGQEIRVAESFRLFSTISTSNLDVSSIAEGGSSLSAVWRRVMVAPSTIDDLQTILKACYPSLGSLSVKLTETLGSVNSVILHQIGGYQPGNSASVSYPSRFSSRDLLKWCKRIEGLKLSFYGDNLDCDARVRIYEEAVAIFAAFSTSTKSRLTIMKEIGRLWEVPSDYSETLYPSNKHKLQELLSELRVCFRHPQSTLCGKRKSFIDLDRSICLLERLASSVKWNEPVLLVGETGTGKTTLVQDLAGRLDQKLTVLNLSQQSDVTDLLGGYKPVDESSVYPLLCKEFENLFKKSFPVENNNKFLMRLHEDLYRKDWKKVRKILTKAVDHFRKSAKERMELVKKETIESVEETRSESLKKRKRVKPRTDEEIKAWENFKFNLENVHGMIFSFVEGAFITAMKNGEWVLLDEVNLAPPETLQRIMGVLEGEHGSLCLAERGDISYIERHPNFRVFACMNPATDAGKRDLPLSLRSRFTEYFVDEVLDDKDLERFVKETFGDLKSKEDLVKKIVYFYKTAKKLSEEKLQDGANQKPQYSLRSLYRALKYAEEAERYFGFEKAIYDGFCMFFLTLLDRSSAVAMEKVILENLLEKKTPKRVSYDRYLSKCYTIGENSDEFKKRYIITASVEEHLRNLARAIWTKNQKYPVLLQGPTSSGKTSLVRYLAAVTNHNFVRINNHEHTDLQEYLGSYVVDTSGNLVFQEGALVKAVRNGDWIVLDELNLAPSDVLEALNRLLDDNRELFVPELQESIHAHPNFMLFATQNPPGLYGGRKMLSRAFRNRFVEIHVDEIPDSELSTILERRPPGISPNVAKNMVAVMKKLQEKRQTSNVFAGKHGFITPRDLFRWADRYIELGGKPEDLVRDGYYLLAERLRDEGEKCVVKKVLEATFRVNLADLYSQGHVPDLPNCPELPESLNVSWTNSMRRLYFLVDRCYRVKEPVLLVGETGAGKTTVCQLLSIILRSKLHILNCHQYSETSDFLGGFYPIRDRSRLMSDFKEGIEELMTAEVSKRFHLDHILSSDIGQASSVLSYLDKMFRYYEGSSDVTSEDRRTLQEMMVKLSKMHQEWKKLFMWQDGPLVQAMRKGDLFLVDEISLADDSVLERLNSVLEPERTLSLAERGGPDLEEIVAHERFFLLATMNPAGDFGKKELSPALRNRFTEIWVPPVDNIAELRSIALKRLSSPKLACILDPMLSFWKWFNDLKLGRMLTVRDLLSWVDFINVTEITLGPQYAFLHGAFLVLLDGLSLGSGISKSNAEELRQQCLSYLLVQLKGTDKHVYPMQNFGWGDLETARSDLCIDSMQCDNIFGVYPFYIEKGAENCDAEGFEILAPTTRRNALRVLRAMQLPKSVLLEGSPGVGKTSLIVALGKFSGHKVVRINLSEQTDMMDLLGSDLPVESDEGMKFAWSDGILLQALKEGSWVLLDELNLAPQSVLEGLNAILDHRAEVFIPELGCTFKCPSSFRIFACQNPSHQGGGRKGLPKSFLNRFTKVYVEELVDDDYLFICSSLYPSICTSLLSKLILFNKRMYEDTMLHRKFALDGSPWEFNLRDVIRSCQIIKDSPSKSKDYCFLDVVYVQRMRTESDRRKVLQLYEQIFEMKPYINPHPRVQLNSQYLYVGNTAVRRSCAQSSALPSNSLQILPGIRQSLEAAACCVEHEWMCILVGPASSGKTSLIRLLAQLTGNVLNELHLSSGTDISELLGCFEQYNAFRNLRSVITRVKFWVNEFCSLQLESSNEAFLSIIKDNSTSRWFALLSSMDQDSVSCFTSTNVEDRERFSSILTLLVKIIKHLKLVLEDNNLSISWSSKELDKVMKTIFKLQEGYERRPGKFEWVTGVLIKAVERGEWIVLENANCCNPSVLDRINSLVEPSGSITLNECGVIDGRPVVLQPHSNFRVFLTVNPRFGEVSRAMRNRGVEIFVMPPYWLMNENMRSRGRIELNDVKRFLVLSGIPFTKLVYSMAKSHIYAKEEGLRFNVCITYLELSRWVQLFQQLLKTGSQPLWSLQTSWEHIYLSSFGEAIGENVISHVKYTYLSMTDLCVSGSSLSPYWCLPGGFPMSMKPRDLVWHSKESSVMTNCMYLEYLGAKYASYKLHLARNRCSIYQDSIACGFAVSYLMGMKIHKAPHLNTLTPRENAEIHKALARVEKKLLFAANWAFEQATESDLKLYLLSFSWFRSQLQPFCDFFDSLVKSITLTMEHKIWKYVSCHYHLLTSLFQVEFEKRLVPMLSFELFDVPESNDSIKFLHNAMCCIMPLRLSYQQWNSEDSYMCEKASCFKPVLKSLRKLEEQFINKFLDLSLIESPSFDALIEMYTDLLEDHVLFWDALESSEFELSLISWHILLKGASKLKVFCPQAVDDLLKESKNLEKISSWRFHSEKSLLWVHGGHPILPCSSKIFEKQLLISELCESVWPMSPKLLAHVNDPIGFVSSDMRFRILEGVSITSCITGKSDSVEDEEHLFTQLDAIYQKLLQMFEKQRIKLKEISSSNKLFSGSNLSSCCSYSTEALGHTSGYDTWRDTSPLVDSTSFALDMKLLLELSHVLLTDPKRMQQDFAKLSGHLKYALDFSLDFSSRPPQVFLPHQKILWILDVWSSVDAANVKMASFVLELWFRWHQSLWIYCPLSVKSFSGTDDYNIPVPDVLLQPVVTATVFQIVQSSISAIKDYFTGSLKLRVASSNLWNSSHPGANLPGFLLSAAHSLFQQIVYAHEKSFDADHFAEIKSVFEKGNILVDSLLSKSRHNGMKESMEKFIEHVGSLISESSHHGLKESVDKFIKPLLYNLYLPHCLSKDFHFNHGCAWLRLGILRFRLLLSCDDMDPAMKYYYKHSQIAEKISVLKLEIQVRQKCDCLAGHIGNRDSDEKRVQTLKKLEVEHKKLQGKIIFRSDFRKFKRLKHECDKFLERVTSDVFFQHVTNDKSTMNSQQLLDQGSNWQKMATGFIEQLLSEKYIEYSDFVQPILVALYEIKLGLSLILSSVMQKRILNRVQLGNTDMILGSIYSFMRFPMLASSKTISVNLNTGSSEFPSFKLEIPTVFDAEDIGLLEKLLTFSSDIGFNNRVSVTQLKAALYQNILVRVAHFVTNARLMDCESFKLLDKIFSESAKNWMSTKIHMKAKQDYSSQQYKFRARAFKLESIIELDISSLEKSFANESFSEWKDFLAEEEEALKEQENSEEELNHMEDASVKDVVDIHNQLFGTSNLVIAPGHHLIHDSERVLSFTASHTLGVEMLKGLGCSFLASLEAKLVPENLFRICLEHEQVFNSSHQSSFRYNFYKDPNTTKMYEMVEALIPLQQRIYSLLNEYEDHPQLQKILDIIEMLLNIPLRTSLAKTLSGLQFLVRCLDSLEDGSKFSFADQVKKPIYDLLYAWRKLELESWPALLDEVQDQYEINAGKLWFPLYSVLRKRTSPDAAAYKLSTIQSVEDFIRTSSIGEFRKRLQLLFAFLGHIKTGVCLEVYSSYYEKENEEILYNAFGYYVQFLPKILAHIESGRSVIEKKLKDLLKPYHWEHHESSQELRNIIEKKRADLLSVEKSKSTRQKLRKIIQEYTVLLEQPVIVFLEQDAAKGTETCSHQGQNFVIDNVNKKIKLMDAAFDWTVINDEDRCMWYTGWAKKADSALRKLQCDALIEFGHSESEGICSEVTGVPNQWSAVWDTLQRIIRKAMDCCELWKDANKSQKKGRSFSDLLNLLKSSGLSRDVFTEDEVNSWWFVEPSFDVQHLLLTESRLPHLSDAALPGNLQCSSRQNLVTEWRMANAYYFTSVESVLFTHQQVGVPDPYLQQFIKIQQDQHQAANKFAEKLRRLKQCISTFEKCIDFDDGNGSKCSIGQNQHATLSCMWQQKQLFDSLYAVTHDEVLLLRIFENTHLSKCHIMKNEANEFLASVEKLIPELQKSKESLDNYLLGPERTIQPSQSFITSKQMEKLVIQNFEVIRQFEAHLLAFQAQDVKCSVKDILLHHLLEIFEKVKLLEVVFSSAKDKKKDSISEHDMDDYHKTDAAYQQALRSTFEHIVEAMQKLGSPSNGQVHPDKSLGQITSWEKIFYIFVENLSLDQLCDKLLRTIFSAEKMVNHRGGGSSSPLIRVEADFKQLRLCLDIFLDFGHALLKELLAMQKTVSLTTHILASLLALSSNGPVISPEDNGDDATRDVSQEQNGTGMGEGVGRTDVSDQITNEDQLIVASEKQPSEEKDAPGQAPSKDDKGIEMEEDFEAEKFSVSEDSEDDTNPNDDEDDEDLDTEIGKTGEDGASVDEKGGNKDEDENPNNADDKYDPGSSVVDKDASSRELRAKGDSDATKELGELDSDELDEPKGETGSQDDPVENVDDKNLDKQADLDPTELTPDDPDGMDQNPAEEMDLDDPEEMDLDDPEVHDKYDENITHEDDHERPIDETMEEPEAVVKEIDATLERDDSSRDKEENTEMNSGMRKDVFESGLSDSINGTVPNAESSTQPKGDSKTSDAEDIAPESNWATNNEVNNELTPIRGLPSNNTSEMDMTTLDSSNNGRNVGELPKGQLPKQEMPSVCRSQPNPYRSIGDALKEWEERVRVSVDLQEGDLGAQDDIESENVEEFGYVSEYEKGTAQALGPATSEQIDKNANGNKTNEDGISTHEDDFVEMEIEKLQNETLPNRSCDSILKNRVEDQMHLSGLEKFPDEGSQRNHDDGEPESMVEDVVSIKKSYLSDDIHQLSKLSVDDDDMGKAQDPGEFSDEVTKNATALWSRYERVTTRLSQELAEQLRLVMEPTLASKLEGDYKTGKRINMKKVIPYIASEYQKDKIWLRRTRPNKRDYQVVIAVDDSRSMSESCCGDVAIEALVTVCRAMSQLEMGSLAVASFGKKGNIRLLHDFDQPFTGDAGVKMISGLSFKQENTILDEPVVDLLTFVNKKLDTAVARARLPSGRNPLQQLVLIIADGHLHEKERLKRCVRDALAKNRMVAFVLVDNPQNPQDSVTNMLETCYEGGQVKFTKYMESFPFPYYIVLRNVEALPRTLADLLRQWFELMQQRRD
ncbi:midasin isoform X3 [Rosa chinensis]|uniref:midasin isoform X3 n=1 Tax=Rosa chinensis TaxID=74649 RepID=UPI001AD9413B|nr:midasin isoform X3 [Rosa chinensis]